MASISVSGTCFRAGAPLGALAAAALVLAGTLAGGHAYARGVYQEPAAFVREAFGGQAPAPKVLWLTKDLRRQATSILGHEPAALRVRYWERGGRTAWVLDEIGKEEPITTGIIVDGGRIERVKVLIFRESRGYEVRSPAFTDQYRGATLDARHELDRPIDGITGATLSVRALNKLTRLALLYHAARERP